MDNIKFTIATLLVFFTVTVQCHKSRLHYPGSWGGYGGEGYCCEPHYECCDNPCLGSDRPVNVFVSPIGKPDKFDRIKAKLCHRYCGCGYGYGCGSGYGYGPGYGSGCGSGCGHGCGSGCGHGCGYGDYGYGKHGNWQC